MLALVSPKYMQDPLFNFYVPEFQDCHGESCYWRCLGSKVLSSINKGKNVPSFDICVLKTTATRHELHVSTVREILRFVHPALSPDLRRAGVTMPTNTMADMSGEGVRISRILTLVQSLDPFCSLVAYLAQSFCACCVCCRVRVAKVTCRSRRLEGAGFVDWFWAAYERPNLQTCAQLCSSMHAYRIDLFL